MHHTNEYSFYDPKNIDLKKFIETPYSKEVYTSLRNIVDVALYCYKRRDNDQCGKKIEDFWKYPYTVKKILIFFENYTRLHLALEEGPYRLSRKSVTKTSNNLIAQKLSRSEAPVQFFHKL